MRALLLAALAAGCRGEPEQPPQAVVLAVPAREAHPAFQVQILVEPALVERVEPEALLRPLLDALVPTFAACDVTAEDAEGFLLQGMLHVDALLGIALDVTGSDEASGCVARAVRGKHTPGPDTFDGAFPLALTLTGADAPP